MSTRIVETMLMKSIMLDNVQIFKSLMDNLYILKAVNISEVANSSFATAAFHNKLKIIKYLLSSSYNINIHHNQDAAFIYACKGGFSELVKILMLELGKKYQDIGIDQIEQLIIAACYYQKVEIYHYVLDFIRQHNPNPNNLHKAIVYTFTASCFCGHDLIVEHIIQYAREIKFEMISSLVSEKVLSEIYERNYVKVAQILNKVYATFNFQIEGDEIVSYYYFDLNGVKIEVRRNFNVCLFCRDKEIKNEYREIYEGKERDIKENIFYLYYKTKKENEACLMCRESFSWLNIKN